MIEGLGFAGGTFIRHSSESDESLYATGRSTPGAKLLLFNGDIPLFRQSANGGPATALMPLSVIDRAPDYNELILLGRLDDFPVFAASSAASASEFALDPAYRLTDLRTAAVEGIVGANELALLAMAKSLLHWHQRNRFCANCGAPSQFARGGFRRDCPGCGHQHFPRTDPVVIMLVTSGGRCLLGRSGHFPPNRYSCLAGFIEPGETVEEAVRRESFEEAGVRVGNVRYVASQPWPFPASLMLACFGEAEDDTLTIDRKELEDARWFSRDETKAILEERHRDGITAPPPVAIAYHLLRLFAQGER